MCEITSACSILTNKYLQMRSVGSAWSIMDLKEEVCRIMWKYIEMRSVGSEWGHRFASLCLTVSHFTLQAEDSIKVSYCVHVRCGCLQLQFFIQNQPNVTTASKSAEHQLLLELFVLQQRAYCGECARVQFAGCLSSSIHVDHGHCFV